MPPEVYAAAEQVLVRAHANPRQPQESVSVLGWTIKPYIAEYRRLPGDAGDVMNLIIEGEARRELQNRLEDLEEKDLIYSAFIMGGVAAGAFVIVDPGKQWWKAPALDAIVREGSLVDFSYGNDACPSLGTELRDGMILQVFTGHPHPRHHTRDGCDPRFAVYVFHPDQGMTEEVAWAGDGEEEAAQVVRRLLAEHGGPLRQPRRPEREAMGMSRKHWDPRRPPWLEEVWSEFVSNYLQAALWSTLDEAGRSLDMRYDASDFSKEAVMQATREANDFINSNRVDLETSGGTPDAHSVDFWLTRNRHGAGFWDRGYGAIGKRLTDAAHAYGELRPYAGDDGKLYFEGG